MAIPAWLPVIIPSAGIILAFASFVWQIRRARFNQSVDLLFRLEADFFGPEKKLQRAKAANDLLAGRFLEAEPILDFFETMALLVRRGALDEEMVWHTFFYWVENYSAATKGYIEHRRKTDPLLWKDFATLVDVLRARQARQLDTNALPKPTPEAVRAFLEEESGEAEF